jgi:hypothetical protein
LGVGPVMNECQRLLSAADRASESVLSAGEPGDFPLTEANR